MPRTKGGFKTRRRRKKILKQARGFVSGRSKLYASATDAVRHAWIYGYRHRKERKRDFRGLWNIRIGAASRALGLSYSRLIHGLKLAGVTINRKMLAEMAIHDAQGFGKMVEIAKAQVAAG